MAYTPKGLVNDTIGAPLEPYKEQELLLPKQCGIPYTTYPYPYHMGYHNLPPLNSRRPRRVYPLSVARLKSHISGWDSL